VVAVSDAERGVLPLLRNRAFLLLQSRVTAAGVGYSVYLATILWLSYRLTGGVFLAGILIAIETAVYTLTFLVGPLVDRIRDKRWVFLACYPVQSLAALALGVSYMLGVLTAPILVGLVVLLAALWDFTWAADTTTTRILFGQDRLFAISGLASAIGGGIDIAMYFAAGVTIALFGAAGGSYLYAALLAVGAALATALPIRTPGRSPAPYLAAFREGWALFRGGAGRALRHLTLVQSAAGFFASAPLLLLTLLVARSFAGSQGTYAGFYVAYLVGGIAIGLVLGSWNPRAWLGPLAIVVLASTGGALFAAGAAAGAPVVSGAAWLFAGAAMTARLTVFTLYLQGRFAPEVLARLSGNNYLFAGVTGTVGAAVFGALSTVWSPAALTDLAAAGFLGCAALAALLPEMRVLRF
jgi:hypothetical protein